MLKKYLLLVFKNPGKQKVFSLINVLGLTVGITCCLMIFLFIRHELSYDNFHKNGKDIYCVVRVSALNGDGNKQDIAWVSGSYAAALKNDYPDAIQKPVRVMPDNDLFSYNNIEQMVAKLFLPDRHSLVDVCDCRVNSNPDRIDDSKFPGGKAVIANPVKSLRTE